MHLLFSVYLRHKNRKQQCTMAADKNFAQHFSVISNTNGLIHVDNFTLDFSLYVV